MMDCRKITVIFVLMLLTACTPQKTEVEPTATEPAFTPTATTDPFAFSEYLPSESMPTITATPTITVQPTKEPPRPTPTVTLEPCEELDTFMPTEEASKLFVSYISHGDVWVWAGSDCSTKQLTDFGNVITATLLEDKKTMLFERLIPHDEYQYAGVVEIWAMDLNGNRQRLLLDSKDLEPIYNERNIDLAWDYDYLGIKLRQVVWIPNTNLVAFSTQNVTSPFPDSSNDLRLLDIETGSVANIFRANQAGNFSLSPNGELFTITTPESISLYKWKTNDYVKDIFTYESVLCYCSGRWYAKPAWSPDSNSILVGIPPKERIEPGAEITVWEIDINDEITTELGSYLGEDWLLFTEDFSPDLNNFVVYQGSTFNINELTMGDTAEPVLSIEGSFRKWAADSNHFLYLDDDTLYLGSINEALLEIFNPHNSASFRYTEWLDDQYFLFHYEITRVGQRAENLYLGSIDGTSTPIISLSPEDSWIRFDHVLLP